MAISKSLRRLAFASGLLSLLSPGGFGDPGFGTLRKRKLDLSVRQPAAVRLANTSFAVNGSSTDKSYMPVVESLNATLETELLANEHTLVKKPVGEAAWVLGLRVTGFALPPPQQSTVNNVTYVRWAGTLHAAYEVLDHGGRVYDAGNVEYTYGEQFSGASKTGSSVLGVIPGLKKRPSSPAPQTEEDVKQILIREVVGQIATKLGNTKRTLEVQVATGDDHLSRAADFIEQRLWARAIEELDKTPVFPRPDKEAYRQYDLGLAYEAMSYDAATFADQRENLFKAQEYYDQALEMNQKERYFVETVARTKDAIARYKAFETMQKDDGKKQATPAVAVQNDPPKVPAPVVPTTVQTVAQTTTQPATQPTLPAGSATPAPLPPPKARAPQPQSTAPPPAPAPKVASAPATTRTKVTKAPESKALTANGVIEMYSSGVPQDQIVAIIQRSTVQFDPYDKDTAIAVARSKLPVNLQNEMRKKVGAPLVPSVPVAPAKK
jgi:hypothetical protein